MPRTKKTNEKETIRDDFYSNEKEIHNALSVGVASEDIIFEEETIKSPQEIEALLYRDLKIYEKNGEILWGTVYAIEELSNHAIICVLYNNQKVSIVDDDYFEDKYDFGKAYPSMTDEQKLAKRKRVASYQVGAKVCFVVKTVERSVITEGDFVGEYRISIIGDRKTAMKTLRDIYFWHKNRKRDDNNIRVIKDGSLILAHILAVKEDVVLCECAGVETKLFAYNLLSNDICENCKDHVAPGDAIKVRVKKCYLNEDGSVYLSITGRINEVPKLIETMKENSSYLGTVESYNPKKQSYTIFLKNGVLATVPENHVKGRHILSRGDTVCVFVVKIYDGFVSGSCMKV